MTSTRPKRAAVQLEPPNGHTATVTPLIHTLPHYASHGSSSRRTRQHPLYCTEAACHSTVCLRVVLFALFRPLSCQDVSLARSSSPLPSGAVRSSARDRKPVKEFIIAATATDTDTTATTNHNNHTTTNSNTAATHSNSTSSTKRSTAASATASTRKSSLSSSLPTSPASSSPPKRPRQFDELTGEELFCICRQPYDSRRFMIGCDECDGWFHAKCVNLSKIEAEASKQWKCPECVKREVVGGGVKVVVEGRKRAGKNGKNGKRKEVEGEGVEEAVAEEVTNGMTRNKENNPTVKEERREDELVAMDDSVGGSEVVRVRLDEHNGGADSSSSGVKGAKSEKIKDRDRTSAGNKSGKDKAMVVKSDKLDKMAKAKRKRDKEERRERSGSGVTNSDRDKRKEGKRAERDTSVNISTINGLVSSKRRDREEEDSKKRRRVDRDDSTRHSDSKSERRRDRERPTVPGIVSESEASEADDARYSWLDKEERDSSSGEEDVYMTSDDEAAEAEVDDADIDGVAIERDESANFDDWKRSGLPERKLMEEDEEESALEALSVKQISADEKRNTVPFGAISLRARTLLSPFSMSAGDNTRDVFLSTLLPDNDSASLSSSTSSSSSSSSNSATALSSVDTSTSASSTSAAADFSMSSPPSVDDLDHLHLHRLHNAKMRVECELLRLEQDRRVYLAGVDYSARMSVMRTMEAFDRRATESVLLEEVEVDEESAKEKERERERQEAETAGTGSVGGGAGCMDVMSSPRVVFPFTPRPPSLSRRPSTNSLTSLPPFSLDSDSISPPLYGTTLTCCGCDGLIPVAIYHQHLLDCAMTAQEAGQHDWIHEAMTYISGQWEEGRPVGGGHQRKKVSAEYNGSLAGTTTADNKRKDRNKAAVALTTDRNSDDRTDGRIDRTTAAERQSEKERERIQQREAAYNRQQLKFNPTPVGTAANRIQGLLPLPPLLHPYPTIPLIRPLRQRTVAATRHSADWERDRERQQEREDEMRREERRRGTKHDKHNLSLNSVSGRFPLQFSHLRLVCGYPMPSSSGGSQQYVYCSREKHECTAHLLWEEVEKVRVEQRYWQLSRRLEMLKAELEPVQFRVSERVMCEADVIGQVLGDSILVEEAEDENMKEETERMAVLVKRRQQEDDKTTHNRVEREKEERDRRKTTVNSNNDDKRTTTAATSAAAVINSPSTEAAKAATAVSPSAEGKRAERRSSTDMEVDEHEGFAMSTSVSDVDQSSPTQQQHTRNSIILPTTSYIAPPAVLPSPYGWMAGLPAAPVRALPHFYGMEPTAAAFVTAAAGFPSAPPHTSTTLPPPPPTHPQPLRVQTGGLGSPVGGSPSGLTSVVGSSSAGSAFSPPTRSAAAGDSTSTAAVDSGSTATRSSSSTVSASSSSSPSASSPVVASSISKLTTPSATVPPPTSLPPPPPPPPLPVQATLAINANPTIPRSLAPATLVSPVHLHTETATVANGTNSMERAVESSGKQLDGTATTAVGQIVTAQPALTAVAT